MKVSKEQIPSSSKSHSVGHCMEVQKCQAYHSQVLTSDVSQAGEADSSWRRQCGCLRTSEKLKRILQCFPEAPPPTPTFPPQIATFDNTCISAYCTGMHNLLPNIEDLEWKDSSCEAVETTPRTFSSRSKQVLSDLVQVVQFSVTATALALYYLIYCYMQMVYFTLRSAIFFHNADGPMKITIGVVTVTSLVVGFNLLLRLERIVGVHI